MTRIFMISATLLLMAAALLANGCGDGDVGQTGAASATSGAASTPDPSSTPDAPATAEFDFQTTAAEFVAADASGDCETAADIQSWTEPGRNRDVSMANCQLVTEELAGLGEPTAISTREETHDDGSVSVWVTRGYSNGSQWEMLTTFRQDQDQRWRLSTFSYGFTRSAD